MSANDDKQLQCFLSDLAGLMNRYNVFGISAMCTYGKDELESCAVVLQTQSLPFDIIAYQTIVREFIKDMLAKDGAKVLPAEYRQVDVIPKQS